MSLRTNPPLAVLCTLVVCAGTMECAKAQPALPPSQPASRASSEIGVKGYTGTAMKVYVLDCGWIECDANWMVAMSVVGTKGNPNPPARWIKIPVYAVLVDHPQGKLLFDTGCAPGVPNDAQALFPYYHHENQTLIKQLELAHTTPDQIKAVVLSHLHFDHAGNIGLFPRAQLYMDRREFEHVQSLARKSPGADNPGGYVKAAVEASPERCHLIDRDQEIAAGVNLISLPGHTAGLLGLVVELKRDGVLVFPSDAAYTAGNYGPPGRLPGIVYDSLSLLASIEKVRDLARSRHAKVIFPHDMELFKTLRTAPACYE